MTMFYRTSSANTYDTAIRNITMRQSALSSLQENLTSGKRVLRPSDDPTSAALAERALTRINRIATDQRALEAQRSSIEVAESTLGSVTDAMQRFRELVVSAGNGVHSDAERRSIAVELQGLRDHVFALANTHDTNGQPLFAALSSALAPFVGPQAGAPDYSFNGLPGQSGSTAVSIPFTLDGDQAFMHHPGRDPVFNLQVSNTIDGLIDTSRTLTTNNPTVVDTNLVSTTAAAAQAVAPPNDVPYPSYTLNFTSVTDDPLTGLTTAIYSTTENPAVSGAIGPVTVTYLTGSKPNLTINSVPGLTFTVSGTPKTNDTITLDARPSVFSVLDDAVANIASAPNNNAASQAISQALHNIDIGMQRISAERGKAGDLLGRADRISANQETRSIELEGDRSRAEDLDMVKGISDFQNQQTGYSAALQTYAQIQKLSLFSFIS